jgi:hypothetical protein
MEEGKEKKYRVTLLFPKNYATVATFFQAVNPDAAAFVAQQTALLEAMKAAANEACHSRFGCLPGELSKTGGKAKIVRNPFRDGAEKANYAGYDDSIVFVQFTSMVKPRIVDQAKQPITQESRGLYNGCWAHASFTSYAYDNITAGVGFGLCNVQKVKDDTPFGGGFSDPDIDFDVVSVGAVEGDGLPF